MFVLQTAKNRGNILADASLEAPYSAFAELINNVQSTVGYDEEIVCFVDSTAYAALCASDEFSRMITISDFKQGDINLKVKSINGVAIIPVVSERMRTKYTFDEQGFHTVSCSSQVFMLALPKSAAHLVKKTEKMRVFTPEQNSSADAYKFDYRIYYDVFVKESEADAIWLWESNSLSSVISGDDVKGEQGSVDLLMHAFASSESGDTISYQWYQCDDKYGRGARKLDGYTDVNCGAAIEMPKGTYYFFCKFTFDGITTVTGDVSTAEVL